MYFRTFPYLHLYITGDFGPTLVLFFLGYLRGKDFFADHVTHVIWRHDRCRPSEHGVPGGLLLGFWEDHPMTCKWLPLRNIT